MIASDPGDSSDEGRFTAPLAETQTCRRLMFVTTGLNTGGAERMLVKLVEGLDQDKYRVVVVSLMDEGTQGSILRSMGVEVCCLRMSLGRINIPMLFRLRRLVTSWRPDVVIGWMYHGNLGALLAGAWRRDRPLIVWNIRQTLYTLDYENRITAAVIRLGARLSARADYIVYNSSLSRLQHMRQGYCDTYAEVIPNGFNTAEFTPDPKARSEFRRELGLSPEAILIGLVARFHPMKDHRTFFAAANRLAVAKSDVHFVLVGRDMVPQNPALATLLGSSSLAGRVYLLGERRDVARIHAAIDVATLTSSYGEGFPNTVGEAMSCGVPCVVTDIGESAFIVADTGAVVPPRNPPALSDAWSKLISVGLAGRSRIGERARGRIVELFSLRAVIEQHTAIWDRQRKVPQTTVRPAVVEQMASVGEAESGIASLFHRSALAASVTFARLASAVIINKLAAISVGPAGFAAIGQFQNFTALAIGLGGNVFSSGIVKNLASAEDGNAKNTRAVEALSLITVASVICAAVVGIAGATLANFLLGDTKWTWLFWLLAVALPFLSLNYGFLALLNGLGESRHFAIANIVAALLTLALGVVLIPLYGLAGALLTPLIANGAAAWAGYFALRRCDRQMLRVRFASLLPAWRRLWPLGAVAAATIVLPPLVQLLIRDLLIAHGAIHDAGIWHALGKFADAYMLPVGMLMGMHFLPRFAASASDHAGQELATALGQIALVMGAIVVAVLPLSGTLIPLLFSHEFLAMESLLPFQLMGDSAKGCILLLQSFLLARDRLWAYLLVEIAGAMLFLLFASWFIHTEASAAKVVWAYGISQLTVVILGIFLSVMALRQFRSVIPANGTAQK